MDQQKTGELICRLRKEHGMTQRELAEKLNVTDKAVSKWERGQSYPDITILSALAETLGVTERELLMGERAEEDPAEPPPTELVVRDTLNYAKTAARQHTGRAAAILMAAYTGALLLAVFVCALCDVLISKGFTWSLIVLASCALAWGAVVPFYRCKRYKLFWSTLAVTLLTPVLLWVIRGVDPMGADWFPYPALLFVGVWLALVWVVVLAHSFTRINKWYIAAAAVFLAIPCNWLTNSVANGWVGGEMEPVSWFSFLSAGILLLIVGVAVGMRGKRRAAEQ